MSLRVLVVDDHAIVREGLRRLITKDPSITVVGEAASKREAFAQISHHNPDVIVVDLHLPDGSGLEVIAWARSLSQKLGIVVLTMSNLPEHVLASMQSGASSHVDKSAPIGELLLAIRASAEKPLSFTARRMTDAVQHGITGYVVDGNNIQEIAARAIELLQDSELRARMGNSGRQWVVDEWRWQIWSEQFNKTLKISI